MNKLQLIQLEKAKKMAESKNGLCLSTSYINNKTPLEWKCSNPNHQPWFARYKNIVNDNQWCVKCSYGNSFGLEQANNIAQSKGGFCLSEKYISARSFMEWKCSNPNHKPWLAKYKNVVYNNNWCPECATTFNASANEQLNKAQDFAQSKGGKCLSNSYINNRTPLEWKCSNPNHQPWFDTFKKIVNNNNWCPKCFPLTIYKNDILKAQDFAQSKGGKCLSTSYVNNRTPLEWKCSNPNHKPWLAIFKHVYHGGTWCPECQSNYNPNALKQAQDFAQSKGGQCLSTSYINNVSPLEWKCSNPNHKPWLARYKNVMHNNNWCPQCAKLYICEKRVRLIFEKFFDKPFPSIRAKWNVNPWTNKLLELDGYCESFNIAFEHDGEHHFNLVRNKFKKDFIYQKFKDEQKKINCIKNGVLLINIPIIDKKYRNNFDEFLIHIVNCCLKYGLILNFNQKQLNELKIEFFLV